MQTTTTVSLPENLVEFIDKQLKKGNFNSRAAFIKTATKTYLQIQEGKVSWEILAAPFRQYAKQKKLTQTDILNAVQKGRRVETSKNS